jgi:hypothetical protein
MKLLRDVVRTYNVQLWAESFLDAALSSDKTITRGTSAGSSPEGTDFPLAASSASQDQRIA